MISEVKCIHKQQLKNGVFKVFMSDSDPIIMIGQLVDINSVPAIEREFAVGDKWEGCVKFDKVEDFFLYFKMVGVEELSSWTRAKRDFADWRGIYGTTV